MTKEFLYNGTFIGYSEFMHFLSKYFPARRMPLVVFEKVSKSVRVETETEKYVLSPGDKFTINFNVEITKE